MKWLLYGGVFFFLRSQTVLGNFEYIFISSSNKAGMLIVAYTLKKFEKY